MHYPYVCVLVFSGNICHFKPVTRPGASPVLQKTTEALSYLKQEHEAKMSFIELQKHAAIWKRKAYEVKTEYYKEQLEAMSY